jgi:hypothetical protein
MGLTAKNNLHFSGIKEAGYTTGLAYIHICTRKGRTTRKSLYLTLRAEINNPALIDDMAANKINIGAAHIFGERLTPKYGSRNKRRTLPMAMSKRPAATGAVGINSLGKYIFVTSLSF